MNISTRGRYGMRAVLDLAQHYSDKPVPLSMIAKRQNLSEGYLEQLIAPLRKAGIVISSRGAQGGYSLARDPAEIKAGEIIRALEGPLSLAHCVSEKENCDCQRKEHCGSSFIWAEIQEAISEVMDRYTLADILAKEAPLASQ